MSEQILCDHVIVQDGRIPLTKNEEVLVCGRNEAVEGWRGIPLPQAQFQLNVILQNQGYLHARFERTTTQLRVWKGPVTNTSELKISGAEGLVNAGKKRKIVGYPLEPKKLDEVNEWIDMSLRRQGYACPAIKLSAQAWDATILAAAEPGERRRISKVETTGLESLDYESIRRYEAFQGGDFYDVIDTQITAARLLNQGLFQSAYFTTQCYDDKVDLHLFTGVGKGRLVRFGLGASTEELPFADLWFKNTHLDDKASSYTASLHGSPIKQKLNISSELYWLPISKRTFLGPRFKMERRKEPAYELFKTVLGIDLGREWDWQKVRWQGRVGPSSNYEKTLTGIGPKEFKTVSWEGSLNLMNHIYEAFSREQYEGWNAGFQYRGQRQGIGSSVNVDRYDVTFKHLWNLGAYSPPLFVFASRFEAIAIDSKQTSNLQERDTLPIDYRIFFGGDENIRGFARESLNKHGLGYLTAAHAGFELRLIEELPYHLQPFLLADVARLGTDRYTLDPPLFVTSGLGIRWASPFGTLRGSAAHGQIWHGDQSSKDYGQHWVYFISFGQEF